MKHRKVLFRVDGSQDIGMGHVMRCLTLAHEISRRAPIEPIFVMREFQHGVEWARRQGVAVVTLEAKASPSEEVSFLLRVIEQERAEAVITDLRKLTPGLPVAVRERGLLCITIDEWGGERISSDLLINGTVVPSWHRYELQGEVHCCVGPGYALMDESFAQVHDLERSVGEGTRILIALGGDDPFFLTRKALNALERVERPLSGTVVIGPAFTDGNQIRQMAAQCRHRWEILENISDMARRMWEADVAITGGGLIALELACTGTPGLILSEVEHQLETAEALERHGVAIHLGLGTTLSDQELARKAADLIEDRARRATMQQAGKELVDGKGCQRVAELILDRLSLKVPA